LRALLGASDRDNLILGWTIVTVEVDRIIGVAKGRNQQPVLAAIIGVIARREADASVVPSAPRLLG
jgi:hypothetical protein